MLPSQAKSYATCSKTCSLVYRAMRIKTYCIRGHERAPPNISSRGACLACRVERVRTPKEKERWRVQRKDARRKNPDRFRAQYRAYYRENPDKFRCYQLRQRNSPKYKTRMRRWRIVNHDHLLAYAKASKTNCADRYLRLLIRKETGVPSTQITADMIEMKREIIITKRLLKKLQEAHYG